MRLLRRPRSTQTRSRSSEREGSQAISADVVDRAAVGSMLAAARHAVGMTQLDASLQTRVPQAKISRIERGIAQPSLGELGALATVYGAELRLTMERSSSH